MGLGGSKERLINAAKTGDLAKVKKSLDGGVNVKAHDDVRAARPHSAHTMRPL